MKPYSFLKSLLLIAALLMSQLGGAFAFAPQTQTCGMDMSSSEHHMAQQMMADMAQIQSHQKAATESASNEMDCCDMTVSLTCCDGDCQCSSFISASVFVTNDSLSKVIKSNSASLTIGFINPMSPFLYQPKRPPITNFS